MDHGLGSCGIVLVVLGQTAIPVEPAEGSFDNPALRQHLKGMEVRAFDDFEDVAEHSLAPIDDALFVAAVDKDFKEMG